MTQLLKQSTAVDVLIGPFVDSGDGWTAETGVSPAVKLSKNGQTLAAKNDVTTPVHDADGYYNCEFDATDTNTVGTLVLSVVGSATSLPVRHEYQVIEEAVYDAMFAASAAGPLQSTVAGRSLDVSALGNAGIDWNNIEDTAAVATFTNTELDLTTASINAIADQVWDELMAGHTTSDSAGEVMNDWQNGGRLDLILDARMAEASINTTGGAVDSVTTVTGDVGGLAAGAITDAQTAVSNELDTAISELGVATPTATPTIRTGLMLLYMALRNQLVTQTSGTDALELHNDAGTLITQKLITDDGSDYTEAKMT